MAWNITTGAYAESGWGMEAYQLFLQMNREGFVADSFTYASILNASASAGALEWVREVHDHARKGGLESNLRVGNALVHMYIMTGAYARSDCRMEAYRLLFQMKREGFVTDAFTYASILNTPASAGALEWMREVHGHARKRGLESNLRVGSALVHMYAKSGSIDDSRLVFDRIEENDVFAWTAMIGGLALHGCGHEALKLFRKMNADCVKSNETTFVALLSPCSHAGLVDDGRRLFSPMARAYGIDRTLVHYNCMVDLLGRAGHLELGELAAKEALKSKS